MRQLNQIFAFALLLSILLASNGCQYLGLPTPEVDSGIVPTFDLEAFKGADEMQALTLEKAIESQLRNNVLSGSPRKDFSLQMVALLGAEVPVHAKAFAGLMLSIYGGDESVPALGELLMDPTTSEHARRALENIPGRRATKALIKGLESTNIDIQNSALQSLQVRNDAYATGAIDELLASQPPFKIVNSAYEALASFNTSKAQRVLKKHRPSTEALLEAWEHGMLRAAQENNKRDLKVLHELWETASSRGVREGALNTLCAFTPEAVQPVVASLLSSADDRERQFALRLAQHWPNDDLDKQLVTDFANMPAAVQPMLLGLFLDRDLKEATSIFESQLNADSASVRQEAIAGLGMLGSADHLKLLALCAQDSDADTRDIADRALSQLKGDNVDIQLLADVKALSSASRSDGSWDAKITREAIKDNPEKAADAMAGSLIRACVNRQLLAAIPILLEHAKANDRPLRRAAQEALATMARPEDAPALITQLMESKSSSDQKILGKAITRLAREDQSGTVTNKLFEAWAQSNDDKQQAALIGQLAATQSEEALALLQNVASGNHERNAKRVRREAIRELGSWQDLSPAPTLLEIARNDEDKALKALALDGYLGLAESCSNEQAAQRQSMITNALDLAKNAQAKRRIIANLAKSSSLDSLDVLLDFLDDDEIKQEAALAINQLCEAHGSADPDRAVAALGQAMNKADFKEAIATIESIQNPLLPDGHIIIWNFSGPHRSADAQSLEAVHNKEFLNPSQFMDSTDWRIVRPTAQSTMPHVLDMNTVAGGTEQKNCVGYLQTTIIAEEDTDVILEIGSDDSIKVFLNGELVHDHLVARAPTIGEDPVPVTLRKGENNIVLKVGQSGLGWGACMRITQAEGSEPANLKLLSPLGAKHDLPHITHVPPGPPPPEVWDFERWEGDPFTGDWSSDSNDAPVLQVYATGGDHFKVNVFEAFDQPYNPIAILEGQAEEATLTASSPLGWHIEGTPQALTLTTPDNKTFEMGKVVRLSPTLGRKAPEDAVIIFDGTNLENVTSSTGGPLTWAFLKDEGVIQVNPKTDSLFTKEKFRDVELHLEFRSPYSPGNPHQFYGNSGIFFDMRYEVQVLCSYGLPGLDNECGALYKVATPRVNMCAPPLQWQTYDIIFHAPQYDQDGKIVKNPVITVTHNGVLIHDHYEIMNSTIPNPPVNYGNPQPIMIQDHHNQVQFRNIWARHLSDDK